MPVTYRFKNVCKKSKVFSFAFERFVFGTFNNNNIYHFLDLCCCYKRTGFNLIANRSPNLFYFVFCLFFVFLPSLLFFFIFILLFKNNVLLQDHIQEVLDKWDNIDDEIWAKESHSFPFTMLKITFYIALVLAHGQKIFSRTSGVIQKRHKHFRY
jgi:hypothetical protein